MDFIKILYTASFTVFTQFSSSFSILEKLTRLKKNNLFIVLTRWNSLWSIELLDENFGQLFQTKKMITHIKKKNSNYKTLFKN